MTAITTSRVSSPRVRTTRIHGSARDRAAGALRIVILTAWAAYFILPLYWLLLAGTKSAGTLSSTPAFAIASPQLLQNLGALFSYEHGLFFRWAANSILYAVAGAAVGTLIASMAGYYVAKYRFRGRETLFSIVLGGVLVPSTALALPLFLLFSQVHLTNTFWAVFLPSIVNPFGFYLARLSAESAVPYELLEAARIDGAGDFRVFFSIASRLMVPGIITIFLTQFVGIWNNFLLPVVMLQDQNLYPITLGLYAWNAQQYAGQTPLQTIVITGSLVSVAPLIVAFVLLQRFWRTGLGTGGIKA
jgi:multiple sugar transport system permease protein